MVISHVGFFACSAMHYGSCPFCHVIFTDEASQYSHLIESPPCVQIEGEEPGHNNVAPSAISANNIPGGPKLDFKAPNTSALSGQDAANDIPMNDALNLFTMLRDGAMLGSYLKKFSDLIESTKPSIELPGWSRCLLCKEFKRDEEMQEHQTAEQHQQKKYEKVKQLLSVVLADQAGVQVDACPHHYTVDKELTIDVKIFNRSSRDQTLTAVSLLDNSPGFCSCSAMLKKPLVIHPYSSHGFYYGCSVNFSLKHFGVYRQYVILKFDSFTIVKRIFVNHFDRSTKFAYIEASIAAAVSSRRECDDCKVVYASEAEFQSHVNSQEHLLRVSKNRQTSNNRCIPPETNAAAQSPHSSQVPTSSTTTRSAVQAPVNKAIHAGNYDLGWKIKEGNDKNFAFANEIMEPHQRVLNNAIMGHLVPPQPCKLRMADAVESFESFKKNPQKIYCTLCKQAVSKEDVDRHRGSGDHRAYARQKIIQTMWEEITRDAKHKLTVQIDSRSRSATLGQPVSFIFTIKNLRDDQTRTLYCVASLDPVVHSQFPNLPRIQHVPIAPCRQLEQTVTVTPSSVGQHVYYIVFMFDDFQIVHEITVAVNTALDKVQNQVCGILNKLSLDNFETLSTQLIDLIRANASFGRDLLVSVATIIFNKAVSEVNLCGMYSDLCRKVAVDVANMTGFEEQNEKYEAQVAEEQQKKKASKHPFRHVLLQQCQEEFERGVEGVDKLVKVQNDQRRRMLGNIAFIGELFKKGMMGENIMNGCVTLLIGDPQNPHDNNIEYLCNLLTRIGQKMDRPKARTTVDPYSDLSIINSSFDSLKKVSTNKNLSQRIRIQCLELIDLRKNNWVPSRKQDEVTTIEPQIEHNQSEEKKDNAWKTIKSKRK